MDVMKTLAATAMVVGLSMNMASAVPAIATPGAVVATSAPVPSACNMDVIVNGAQTKTTKNSCEGVGTTVNTCLTACNNDYVDLFPAGTSNASKTKLMKAVIPIAINDLGLNGTPLSNMRDCCKVYNNNVDCGV
jgi:hypothetical protein